MGTITKIIRNESGGELTVGGVVLADSESYTIPQTQYTEWAFNPKIPNLIQSGDLVVNNGDTDLSAELGETHIKYGIIFVHEDISLLPGVGENAPELSEIDSASVGFIMQIGDKIYGQTRIDGLVGDDVELQIHYTIDNDSTDKYVEFDVSYFTTNGRNDSKNILTGAQTITMGPEEVEDSPWLVREIKVNIPSSAFGNNETYLYFGIERKTPTSLDSPTNNPVILRYCKQYYKVDN